MLSITLYLLCHVAMVLQLFVSGEFSVLQLSHWLEISVEVTASSAKTAAANINMKREACPY